ncbi:MAG TPA: hypothetical protein VG826_11440 [Pirellulales bacterium]|nr:hypothetical protein [Pirellulales bacterium]
MTINKKAEDLDEGESGSRIPLQPVRRFRLRFFIWLALCALALIGTTGPGPKFAFCLSMGLLLGSFPQAYLREGAFHRELFVIFFRVQQKRWKLSRFVQIEIDVEESPFDSMANVFKLGELLNRIWGLFDACVPWLGGDYKIYLRGASGKRVLAWQGSNDEQFQGNLDLLGRTSGLKVERR